MQQIEFKGQYLVPSRAHCIEFFRDERLVQIVTVDTHQALIFSDVAPFEYQVLYEAAMGYPFKGEVPPKWVCYPVLHHANRNARGNPMSRDLLTRVHLLEGSR